MRQYQQTLIIPEPNQRIPGFKTGPNVHGKYGNRENGLRSQGINSILAYFE